MLKLCRLSLWFAIVAVAMTAPADALGDLIVPGSSDPYLAGMPDGSTASGGDVAPAQSPPEVLGVDIVPGTALSFSVTGSVNYGGGPPTDPPDGGFVFGRGAENGISGYTITVDSLLGVFLGPDRPDLSPPPASLDFSTAASRDYLTLFPLLQQTFFIGDGLTSTNVVQHVIVPAGATRLFLGTADGFGWYNNTGSFDVTVNAVPEPSSLALVCTGAAIGFGVYWRRRLSRRVGLAG
jgi:hypothetical protein